MADWRLYLGNCKDGLRELPAESAHALLTDGPYGLSDPPDPAEVLRKWLAGEEYVHPSPGFIGCEWDSFVPGPEIWREAFRVLKPGAYGVAFAGTRTVDWMSLSLRLAGFDIRDTGGWVYWNANPKGPDVSNLLDRMRDDTERVKIVTGWLRERRIAAGLTNKQVDQAFHLNGMACHWTSPGSQPILPTAEQWVKLLELFGWPTVPDEIGALWTELDARKGTPEHERPDRVTRTFDAAHNLMGCVKDVADPGSPISDLAKRWRGTSTLLKPTWEPWILFQKPFKGTIARNIVRHGVGALQIDAARLPPLHPFVLGPNEDEPEIHTRSGASRMGWFSDKIHEENHQTEGQKLGRYPRNLIHVPKPSKREREAGLESIPDLIPDGDGYRNDHPTLKPIALCGWLAKLICPPEGKILDPFMGSGTVGCAAVPLGFDYWGAEIDPKYHRISGHRISHWLTADLPSPKPKKRPKTTPSPEPQPLLFAAGK